MKRHKKLGITGPLHLTEVHRKHRVSRRGSHESLSEDDDRGHMFSNMLQQLAWEKDIDLTKGQALITDPDLLDTVSPPSPERITHFPNHNMIVANGRPRTHTKYVKTPAGTPKQSPKQSNKKFNYNRVSPLTLAKGTAPPPEDSGSDAEVSKVLHSSESSRSFTQRSKTDMSVQEPDEDVKFRGSKPPGKPHKLSWDVPKYEKSVKTDDESTSQDGSLGTKSTSSVTSVTKLKDKTSPGKSLSARDRVKEMEQHSQKKSNKSRPVEKTVPRSSSTTSLLDLSDCKESEL